MADIKGGAASTFRDYQVDGVPASGPHEPEKASIRSLFALVQERIGGAVAGLKFYATKVALDADTTQPLGTLAYVYDDATPANNTVYHYETGGWVIDDAYFEGVASVVQPIIDEALAAIAPKPFDSVVIYSNSMATSGASSPALNSFGRVAETFNLPVAGMAVPGAPSTHVAAIALGTGLSLASNTLVSGANSVTATNFAPIVSSQALGDFYPTGQFLSSPADAVTRELAGTLCGARVTLKRERTGEQEVYTVTTAAQQPPGLTLPVTVPPNSSFIPDDLQPGIRAIRVLMAFENDFYDFATASAAATAFVERFGVDDCIIFGVQNGTVAAPSEFGNTGNPGDTSIGPPGGNFINLSKLLAWLNKTYPGAVVDPIAAQLEFGLDDSGQTLSGAQLDQFNLDKYHVIVPAALRTDDRHPNNGGHLSRMKRARANADARGMIF